MTRIRYAFGPQGVQPSKSGWPEAAVSVHMDLGSGVERPAKNMTAGGWARWDGMGGMGEGMPEFLAQDWLGQDLAEEKLRGG